MSGRRFFCEIHLRETFLKRTLCREKKLQSINWTIYGKIKSITKPASTIYYGYAAAGNRVHKKITGTNATEEIYVRDAQGNPLAVYRLQGDSIFWKEQHLYGSSRLGIYQYHGLLPAAPVVTNGTVPTLSDSLLMGIPTMNYRTTWVMYWP